MDIKELGRLDLNLLVALEALLEERSVSRAAERLYITQSAMSKTLGRLREQFDDELFVRRSGSMVPTARAEQLAVSLPQVLLAVRQMIQPAEFDPAIYDGEIRLMVQKHIGSWLLPDLTKRLAASAPKMRVTISAAEHDVFDRLEAGKLDFALQIERHVYPRDLDLTTLAFVSPIIVARKDHPLVGRDITLNELAAYPRVGLVATDISGYHFYTGEGSALHEYSRSVVPRYQTDDMQTAVQIVRRTDCLLAAPPNLIEHFHMGGYLTSLPVPGISEVSLKYVVVRHSRALSSAPHVFFYNELIATTEEIRGQLGLPSLADLRRKRNLEY